jgi:hypothetical protein
MSQPFPVDPFFAGSYAPLTFEADAADHRATPIITGSSATA